MQVRRPAEVNGIRLFYRTAPKPTESSRTSINYRRPLNMVIQIRLYQWSASDSFLETAARSWYREKLFADYQHIISLYQIGRIMSDCVQYAPHHQHNANPKIPGDFQYNCWRFNHRLDLHYGIERMICSWLPILNRRTLGEAVHTEADLEAALKELLEMPWEDVEKFVLNPAKEMNFHLTRPSEEEEIEFSGVDDYVPPPDFAKIAKENPLTRRDHLQASKRASDTD